MESLYIIGTKDQVLYEHNWCNRSFLVVADGWIKERAQRQSEDSDIAPITEISGNIVFSATRGLLTILCIASRDIDAAYGLEIVHRIFTVFEEYFGISVATTELIQNNLDTVTELLCEMFDHGHTLTLESDAMKDLVLPPSLLNKLMNVAGMQSKYEQQGQLSTVPWRRAKVKYTSNEIFVDVVEELKATIDRTGKFVTSDINGEIICNTKLSGSPDVTISLKPTNLLTLPLLHQCIDRAKFQSTPGTVSFMPPDGQFSLLSYSTEIYTNRSSPLAFGVQFAPGKQADSFEIVLSVRQGCPESLVIEVPLPASCKSVRYTPNRGDCIPSGNRNKAMTLLQWTVPGLSNKVNPNSKIILTCSNVPDGLKQLTYVRVTGTMGNASISGLKVDSLKIHRAGDWKPYKGVKYTTTVDVVYRVR
ncbi:hypothetical protein MRB53_039342 [Persea americana]|nr:hypothetical protein MRB53_039342 [Persea americana]